MLKRFLILLCLGSLLTSCTTTVIETETVRMFPPAALMLPTVAPTGGGDSVTDVLFWGMDTAEALKSCNADKAKARQWKEEVNTE